MPGIVGFGEAARLAREELDEDAHGSVRSSLGYGNSDEQVDYVVEQLPPIIERLRMMSPLARKAQGA